MDLPPGLRIHLDAGTRRVDGGRVLIGGSPLRIVRLTAAGAELVDRLVQGEPVPAAPRAERLVRRLLDAGLAHPDPPPGPWPSVAVVIPVRDEAVRPSVLGWAPTVVVDDGSRAAVTAPDATVLRSERPAGPAAARNVGWRATTAEVVVFLDADCAPAPGWLDALLPHFCDPAVAAVAPRVTSPPGAAAHAAYDTVRSPLDRGAVEAVVRPGGRVPFVPTAALAVRRSVLEELGGFDEAMPVGEDVDFVWRCGQQGWTVRYAPAACVGHPPRDTFAGWVTQRFRYGQSAAPLAQRHGPAVAPLAVSGWSAAAWGLAGLGFPGTGAGVAASTTALLVPRLRGLEHPATEAVRLAGKGHVFAGRQVADAVRRAWWPAALVAALVSRRARKGVAAAFLIPPIVEWVQERPPLDPLRWLGLRIADDVAYGAGLWAGCVREGSFRALLPDLQSWPGRRPAVDAS